MARPGNYRPLVYAGILLGFSLGSVLESIVFRQIFQLHGFVSSRVPLTTLDAWKENLFWGGCFQAFTWALALIGLRWLWRAGRRGDVPWRGKAFAGSFVFGWGFYLLLEGMLFHHVFRLHHLVEAQANPWRTYWDIAFLAWGAIFLGLGAEMLRKDYDAFLHRRRQWKEGRNPLKPVTPPRGTRSM